MLLPDTEQRPTTAFDAPSRRTRQDGRPRVSVVAVVQDDSPSMLRTLSERATRWERFGVECVIVCASRRYTKSTFSAITGAMRVIHGPADATEPRLRAVGLAAATGDVVMLVDDLATADDRWIEHVSVNGSTRPERSPV